MMLTIEDLSPALQVRAKALRQEGEILCVLYTAHRRGVTLGIPFAVDLKAITSSMQRVNDEFDVLFPPDEEELEARRFDKYTRGVMLETESVLAKTQRQIDAGPYVDARYRRIAAHASAYAAKQLAPSRPAPQVKFFDPDGDAAGYFRPRDPEAIYVSVGLSDLECTRVAIHETAHWAVPSDRTEKSAKQYEALLVPEYCEQHGRSVRGQWCATV